MAMYLAMFSRGVVTVVLAAGLLSAAALRHVRPRPAVPRVHHRAGRAARRGARRHGAAACSRRAPVGRSLRSDQCPRRRAQPPLSRTSFTARFEEHRRELTALQLPHARLLVRGRGRGAGDVHSRLARLRPLRGARGAALVALPDRHQRLPRHARRARAARAPDGSRPCPGADRVEPEHAARGDVDPADADGSPRARRRPGRGRRGARDDQARVRRRAPAPAAAAARGARPLRGAALAGDGGRRAARDERRLGQQRPPARAGDARAERRRASPPRPISAPRIASSWPAT